MGVILTTYWRGWSSKDEKALFDMRMDEPLPLTHFFPFNQATNCLGISKENCIELENHFFGGCF